MIERHAAVDAIAGEWDALAERLGAAPFLRPGWFAAWYAAFARRAVILAARDADGRLTGVLPLVQRRTALEAAANWHSPVFGPLAEGDGARRELAAETMGWAAARVDLNLLDADDAAFPSLRAAARDNGRAVMARVVERQPFVRVDGSFEDYMSSMPAKIRREIRRRRRRLEGERRVDVEFVGGGEHLDRLLEEGFAVEGSGWKEKQGSAILSKPEVTRFYTDVSLWAAERGWLVLGFLRVDGRAVAFELSLEAAGAFNTLKRGFDPEYRRFGPGMQLIQASIERAFDSPVRTYEFLGSEEEYKLQWAGLTRDRVRLQAFRRSPAGLAQLLAWRYGRPVAKRALAVLRRS